MKKYIKLVIVEDDESVHGSMEIILTSSFPTIKVVGKCISVKNAIDVINNAKPDLVLLDLGLPDGSGFDVIENTKEIGCKYIIISGDYSCGDLACKYSALAYIYKPINVKRLIEAVDVYMAYRKQQISVKEKELILKIRTKKDDDLCICENGVSTSIKKNEILYCKSDGTFSKIFMKDNNPIIISKPLKKVFEILNSNEFVRVHKKHIVNINHISNHKKGTIHKIEMNDKTEFIVGRVYKSEFLNRYNEHKLIQELKN